MQTLDDLEITKEDFIELSQYTYKIEQERGQLLEQLRECKAALAATVQQRNSLHAKLQNMLLDKANTVNVQAIKTEIVTNAELVNPEQWAVPEGKVITTPKSNKQ